MTKHPSVTDIHVSKHYEMEQSFGLHHKCCFT